MSATTGSGALTLEVAGMTCGSCKRHVEEALAAVAGVGEARVDLAGGCAAVSFDPALATPEQMLDAVRRAGYGARVAARAEAPPAATAPSCACCASHAA